LKTAGAIATYEQDYYAKSPAITHNTFGKGNAFYVGTAPDNNGMEWLLEQVCSAAGVQSVAANVPAGIEILQRDNEKSSFLFVLNHSSEKLNVHIDVQGHELLTGTEINGSVELESSGVAVIQMK
jgi:beta-galactosidase